MVRSVKPIPPADISNVEHSTQASAKRILPVDTVGTIIEPTDKTILASAARTATFNSSTETNRGHRGIMMFLDVTGATSSGSLTPKIEALDPASGSSGYFDLLGSTAISSTAIKRYGYVLYPGFSSGPASSSGKIGDIIKAVPYGLPRTYRFTVTHGSTRSWTYSIGRSLLL